MKGKNFSDDQTKANMLNIYVFNIYVYTNEPQLLHSLPTLNTNVKCTLYNLEILHTEVRTKLTNLKPDKASGPDLLNVSVLKIAEISIFLQPIYLINPYKQAKYHWLGAMLM